MKKKKTRENKKNIRLASSKKKKGSVEKKSHLQLKQNNIQINALKTIQTAAPKRDEINI
jgi:hypothetical protein